MPAAAGSRSAWTLASSVLDLQDLPVAGLAERHQPLVGRAELLEQGVECLLGLLQPLHHLELLVLQRGDPALEGLQLVLHPLEVLGVVDQPLVHPVAVARAPGLDLLDVAVDLLLLGGEVVDDDPGVAAPALERRPGSGPARDLGELRQVRQLVAQLVGSGVELLDVEQLELGERVGFQGRLLSDAEVPGVGADRAHPGLHRIAQRVHQLARSTGSQVHSAAQWATSTRAGPSCSRNSDAGWWRRSLVT